GVDLSYSGPLCIRSDPVPPFYEASSVGSSARADHADPEIVAHAFPRSRRCVRDFGRASQVLEQSARIVPEWVAVSICLVSPGYRTAFYGTTTNGKRESIER